MASGHLHPGKDHTYRLFDNEIDAARAYDREAIKRFGPFTYLDFPHKAGRG